MIQLFAMFIIAFILGAMTVAFATRKERALGREVGQAELLYVRHYDKVDAIYLGGEAPRTIYPGRVEVLWFPADATQEADAERPK